MRKLLALYTCLFSFAAAAQNHSETAAKGLGVISSVGAGIVDKDFSPAIKNSTQTSTGLEYRVSDHSSFAAQISFDNYAYRTAGVAFLVEGKLKATGLTLSYRHRFGAGSWRPYLKGGGGLMRLSVPVATTTQGFTRVGNRVEVTSLVSAEAGIQFRVYRRYSVFAGAEKVWWGKSDLLNNSVRVTNIKVGLITSL